MCICAEKGIIEYYNDIKNKYKYTPMKEYDPKSEEQRDFIKTYASAAIITPKEVGNKTQNTEPKWQRHKTKTEEEEPQHNEEEIRLYTDGSCPENSKVNQQNSPAGWGIAIYKKLENERTLTTGLFGPVETKHNAQHFLGAELGSNNTGELTAICEGLKWLLEHEQTNKPAAFYYDSKYAAKITTGEYNAESNKYLAAKARILLQQVKAQREIRLEHIKGHSNDEGNDAADELANKGATGKTCRTEEEWNNIKHTHPEKPAEKDTTRTDTTPRHNRAVIQFEDRQEITIPLPTYGYGATRRSRFAFGRISAAQARTNTANQLSTNTRDTININDTEQEQEYLENSEMEEQTIEQTETETYLEEEPEEENIFLNDDNPTSNEIA